MNPVSHSVIKAVAATLPGLPAHEAQTRRRLLQTFQAQGLDADRDTLNRIADILNAADENVGDVPTMRSYADLLCHVASARPSIRYAGCAV